MTILIDILAFLVVFMFIVVVHEFGHFVFARVFGVKVHEFAIGFGPQIYRKPGKKTDFRINAFPLGGYVRLKGEDPAEEESPDSLYGVSAWKRFIILLAGPVFSILAGYLLFVLIIGVWGYKPIIIDKVIPNSPAEQAGLKSGDLIIKLNGKYVFDTVDMTDTIKKGETITLEILRDGKTEEIAIFPKLTDQQFEFVIGDVKGEISGKILSINNMDLVSYMTNWKNEVVTIKSESGEMSGVLSSVSTTPERYTIGIYYGQFSNVFAKDSEFFSKGDKLLQINGFEINSSNDLFDAVTSLTLKSDEVYVSTDGEKIDRIIRPSSSDVKVVYESKGERKEITIAKDKLIQTLSIPGVLEQQSVTLRPKGFQVVSLAVARSNRLSVYIWKSLPGIFVGRNLDEVAGPVGMVQIIGQAAQIGLETILTIVAMITINLGIFNLFPLPALDGGRIIFALIEMITRKKINRNVENWIHAIGFFLLIGLVIFITFIDVGRFFM